MDTAPLLHPLFSFLHSAVAWGGCLVMAALIWRFLAPARKGGR